MLLQEMHAKLVNRALEIALLESGLCFCVSQWASIMQQN